MSKYKVSEECIGCRACVEVANSNFEMNNSHKAFVIKQPETNDEEDECEDALGICPVNAIFKEDNVIEGSELTPIFAKDNIKEILDKYPKLKDVLVNFSDKFKKLLNPVMYNTLARFATFNDAAKVTGISVCEIIHVMNGAIGTVDQLHKFAPECIKEKSKFDIFSYTSPITWPEVDERYIYNHDTMPDLIGKISKLKSQENIVIISVKEPIELVKAVAGLELTQNIEKSKEYRVSIFNNSKEEVVDWKERKSSFDVINMKEINADPFDIIIKKSRETSEDDGFTLVQRFEPLPIINMLTEMGFEHITEQKSTDEFHVYFHKKISEKTSKDETSTKVDVVIQSATPVAYPVIMKLLQSEKIKKHINITELKIWEETEKHLAWITNGKADISFSALITSAKLRDSDIKIPALFVWDNFVLLTRYKANDFNDIKGKSIYTPLFEEAPPAKITKYLIKASGLNVDDFKFTFGKPFGRPEEIYKDFVTGKADTVILREPEASYAIKILQDRDEDFSVLSFNEIWNKVNPGYGSFPNAGLVFKGEFVKKHPELSKIFLEELKLAIDWVSQYHTDAAKLAFGVMQQPVDRVELFLNRVMFDYVEGEPLVEKVKQYFEVLNENEITDVALNDEFFDIFKL